MVKQGESKKGEIMTRNLSDKDIREMGKEEVSINDKRKGDRRKAITSCIDPKHDRRCYDRRRRR